MQNCIDLSIVVSTYNAEKTVGKCLESVCKQNIKNLEVVVVDDASSDGTVDIINQYKVMYSNICFKLLLKKKNEGLFLSRLDGMHQTSGKYVSFVDHDDTISDYSQTLEVATTQNIDILQMDYRLVNDKGEKLFNRRMKMHKAPVRQIIYGTKNVFSLLKFGLAVQLYARLYRKRLCNTVYNTVISVPNYRKKFKYILNEDEFLTPLFFSNAKSFYYMNEELYQYRFLSNGGTMYMRTIDSSRQLKAVKEFLHACSFLSKYLFEHQIIDDREANVYNLRGWNFLLQEKKKFSWNWKELYSFLRKHYSLWEMITYNLKARKLWL